MGGVVDTFRLDGRVALVAGAGDGSGRAVASALREAGATVVVAVRGGDDSTPAAGSDPDGVATEGFPSDDLTGAGAEELAKQVVERHGRIDILVNNLGTSVSPHVWREVMSAAVDSPYFVAHAVGAHMIDRGQGGKILNIAPAPLPDRSTVAEDTAHGAMANFTRALATMLAPHGILVNCICAASNPLASDAAPRHTAEDVKGLAVFLASDASAYITGQVITVDVGMTALLSGGELHDRL
jgi:gluconate 5-dehydrogenase